MLQSISEVGVWIISEVWGLAPSLTYGGAQGKVRLHRGLRVGDERDILSFGLELVGRGHVVVDTLLIDDRRLECGEEGDGPL